MRAAVLPFAAIILLIFLHFILPAYHHGLVARAMVLACFAAAYNLVFGYAGLLSLGHAMYFGAGLYAAGLGIHYLDWAVGTALLAGIAAGGALALATGALALRTAGVAFMIVTLMFGQAAYLFILYFTEWTRGDEGIALAQSARTLAGFDLTDPDIRYLSALALLSVTLGITFAIARAPFGRVLVAIRENEPRAQMLGYDTYRAKLLAMLISGLIAGGAGAAYGVLFGSLSASFASIQYSILALLWVLLGGSGTVIGPLIGVLALTYIRTWSVDGLRFLSDLIPAIQGPGVEAADQLVVGLLLILLILFFREGLAGTLRTRLKGWLA